MLRCAGMTEATHALIRHWFFTGLPLALVVDSEEGAEEAAAEATAG